MPNPEIPLDVVANLISGFIALLALVFSIISFRKSINNTTENTRLSGVIEDRNNEKHWRREKIYDLANQINEKCCLYWTEDYTSALGLLHFRIPAMIDDLEGHASSLGIDITREIVDLKNHSTGNDFGSPSRTKLDCQDYRLLLIQQEIQKIKKKV